VPTTLHRILRGQGSVNSEMALRLAECLGRSPESWLAMQAEYDLWFARQTANAGTIKALHANKRP